MVILAIYVGIDKIALSSIITSDVHYHYILTVDTAARAIAYSSAANRKGRTSHMPSRTIPILYAPTIESPATSNPIELITLRSAYTVLKVDISRREVTHVFAVMLKEAPEP